jgi:hypothetical protein
MESIRKNLVLIGWLCCAISAADTMLQISTICFVTFAKHFSNEVAIGAAVVLGGVVAYVLDKVNHAVLTPTLEGFTSSKAKENKGLYGYLLSVVILLSTASISISYFTREQVAAALVAAPTLHNITGETAKLGGNETAALEAQKADLKGTYKKEIQAAKNTKIAALAASGNAWAAQKQSSIISKIDASFSTKTEAVNGKIAALIERQSENKNRLVTQLQTENAAAITAANSKIDVVSKLQMYISIGCTFGMFIAALGLAFLWSRYKIGTNPLPDIPSQKKPTTPIPATGAASQRSANLRSVNTINTKNTVITPKTDETVNKSVNKTDETVNETVNKTDETVNETVNVIYQNGGLIVTEKDGFYKAIFNSAPMDKTKLSQYISVFQGRFLKAQSVKVSDELKHKISILQRCKSDMYG